MSRAAPPRERLPEPVILLSDEHLLAVDKPAGVVSLPTRGDERNLPDLMRALRLVPPDEPFRPVHRLDRDTSGVILFARTLEAQRSLTRQFERRGVEKVYLALVQGGVEADGQVNLPLSSDKSATRSFVDRRRGKPSCTRYRVLERFVGSTLLECRPLTGRTHQVRVHLAAIGHPLAVDPLYGGGRCILLSSLKPGYHPSRRRQERPLIERLTLHALRLTFDHPALGFAPRDADAGDAPEGDEGAPCADEGRVGLRVTVEAPLPRDFRATLNQLRRLA